MGWLTRGSELVGQYGIAAVGNGMRVGEASHEVGLTLPLSAAVVSLVRLLFAVGSGDNICGSEEHSDS